MFVDASTGALMKPSKRLTTGRKTMLMRASNATLNNIIMSTTTASVKDSCIGSSCRRLRRRSISPPTSLVLRSFLLLLSWIFIVTCAPVIVHASAEAVEEEVCTAGTPTGGDGSCLAPESSSLSSSLLGSQEDALIKWIVSLEGGSVATDQFRIARTDYPDDSLHPEFDFIATQDIPKGTVLMEIPESAVIGGGGDGGGGDGGDDTNGHGTNGFFITQAQIDATEKVFLPENNDDIEFDYAKKHLQTCEAIDRIVNERVEKGADSLFHPYLEFVFGTGNPKGKQPANWSNLSQFIFWGQFGQENTVYTPNSEEYRIKHSEICEQYKTKKRMLSSSSSSKIEPEKDLSAFERFAYHYFSRYSWGTSLIPLFDMIPHRNGKWKNVEGRFVDVETGTTVPVKPREQRYNGFVRTKDDSINGKNATSNISSATKLVVYAHRDIAAGEPLRVSYNQCEHLGCENLKNSYTSSNLIADAGIVEEYPRRWRFHLDFLDSGDDNFMLIDIDLDPNTGERTFDLLSSTVDDVESHLYTLALLSKSVDRWNGLKDEIIEHTKVWNNKTSSRRYEYEGIYGIHEAYTEAFNMAWLHRHDAVHDPSAAPTTISTSGNAGGSKQHTMEGYDELTKFAGPALNTKGHHSCCAEGAIADNGKLIDDVQGFYQKLSFKYEPEVDNTYMEMETKHEKTLHSSSNFRAHYHESAIHVALQYVKNPKRVAYIGGGDNMVIAEILKYPGIEKVVGLELDQQVCRSSMKYFGTTPAFHDDRVEWWFGNGAVSLHLIPEQYFGSFDLVLVDLLTVVAEGIPVTADVSLAEVAPLLMKPDGGVLARNEDFVDRSESSMRLAQRVVMYDYWDSPRLCETSITIASNSVDFAKGKRYNHGVETLVRLMDFDNNAFTGWSRYYDSTTATTSTATMNPGKQDDDEDNAATTKTWSNFNAGVCNKIEKYLPKYYEQQQQLTSLRGVLLVIEAENVTESLESENLSAIHDRIINIATDHELSSFASIQDPHIDANAFVMMCDLGYIKMQTYPEFNYVAFDLVLWGDNLVMKKLEAIQKDLIAAVGGGILEGSVSSYRVSTGGMSVKRGKEQQQQRKDEENNRSRGSNGLVEKALEYYCGTGGSSSANTNGGGNAQENKEHANDNDAHDNKEFEDLSILIHEITSDIPKSGKNNETLPSTFAIFCGTKDSANCESYRSVSSPSIDNLHKTFHPVYSCESFEDMADCESQITQRLLSVATDYKRLDGFVLDSSISLDMGKILHKVFNSTIYQDIILERSFIALARIDGDESSSWRNIFLDRFRTEIIVAPPVHKADFEISNGIHTEAWSVVSVRRDDFFGVLHNSLKAISEKSGWVTTTKKILDSIVPLFIDWDPGHIPKDADFFREDVMEQWFGQRPLASQFLLQMEVESHLAPLEVLSLETLEEAFKDAVNDAGFTEEGEAVMQNFKVGKGYLVSFLSTKGSGILKWDGESRVEVNMLVTDIDLNKNFDSDVHNFTQSFLSGTSRKAIKSLKSVAQDVFPRGYGKVVNFQQEIIKEMREDGKAIDYIPLWMHSHVPEAMMQSSSPQSYYRVVE
jgi:spermidine synthase